MENIHDQVKAALNTARYITECAPQPMTIGVSNTSQYLCYYPTKDLNFGLKPGDPIRANSMADRVIKSGKRVSARVGAEVFGVPYIGVGVPILNDVGNVVGSIVTGTNIEVQEKTKSAVDNLALSLKELALGSQNQAATSQNLASIAQSLAGESDKIMNGIRNTDKIVAMIKSVSDQTNILGLNAAIEAARVGKAGLGFSVVAEEIRKLATHTNMSVKEITSVLKGTQNTIMDLIKEISEISAVAEEQAATSEQIAATIEQSNSMAEILYSLAENLV